LRRWRWLAVGVLCVAVNAAYLLPFYFAPRDGAATNSAATLRLLHANVNAGNRNFDALISLVRTEQPDIFVVQEATRGWLGALEVLRDTYKHRLVVANRGEQHIALYSRLPLAEVKAEAVAGEFAPPAHIIARITQDERAVTILTMHTPNPPDPARTAARNRELAFAAEVARESAKPFVIIGDLNITMWSPYFAKLKADGNLRDARTGFGVLPSWSPLEGLPLIPIDHCLVSPDVSVRNLRTGANIGSDHRPLIVELAF
jgi:endonuclease/exonuclease/phosphatase (EEP) superfamily protein YafD